MRTPFLSVVIPAYNRADLITPCVKSILQADIPDVEIIIVDDCSTDDTLEVCRGLAAENPEVQSLHLEENKGQGFARGVGLEAAKGQFVFFADSDDEVDSDNFRQLLEKRTLWEQSDAVVFNYVTCTDTYRREDNFYTEQALLLGDDLQDVSPQNSMWEYFYRRDFLLQKGLTPLRLCISEDRLFVCETLLLAESVFVSPLHIYHYYRRAGGASHKKLAMGEWLTFLEWYGQRLSAHKSYFKRPVAKSALERLIRLCSLEAVGALEGYQGSLPKGDTLEVLLAHGAEAVVQSSIENFWDELNVKTNQFSIPLYICPGSVSSKRFAVQILEHGGKIAGFVDKRRSGCIVVEYQDQSVKIPIYPFNSSAVCFSGEPACFLILGSSLAVENAMLSELAKMRKVDKTFIITV